MTEDEGHTESTPTVDESLGALLAIAGAGMEALGRVFRDVAQAAVPALADLRRALEAIEDHAHRPGRPHGPARDPFRRHGRG